MRKFKKLFCFVIAFVMIINCMAISSYAYEYEDGKWHYDVVNDEAIIAGYDAVASVLTVPAQIGRYPRKNYPVKHIGPRAFYGTRDFLQEVYLPDGILSIGNRAFLECPKLRIINLPDSLLSIDDFAFSHCYNLENVFIPPDVSFIGGAAFCGCTSLASIDVSSDNKNYLSVDGVLFNKEQTILMQYPAGKLSSSYEIPKTVLEIDGYSFVKAESINTLFMPSSIEKIGLGAFAGCLNLTDIYYDGTEEDWNNIINDEGYGSFDKITIHFHKHEYTESILFPATCTLKGIMANTCKCGDTYNIEIPATNHKNSRLVDALDSTCIIDGFTEGYYCPDCDTFLTGHEMIPAKGHTPGEWITDKAADAGVEGSKHKECTVCYTVLETAKIPALPIIENAIKLDKNSVDLDYKSSAKINAEATGNVVWTSSNPSVVSVDGNGNVKALKPGSATVTATVDGTDVSASCEVTVKYSWWQWIIVIVLFGWIWY